MAMIASLAYSQRGFAYRTGDRYSSTWIYNVSGVGVVEDPTTADGLPKIGEPVPGSNPLLWCVGLVGETVPDREDLAVVRAEFVDDPILRPVEVSFFSSHKTEAVWRAEGGVRANGREVVNGEFITNAAGDLYNPPLTRDKPLLRMEVVRRYHTTQWNPAIILAYKGCINSKTWMIQYVDGNGNMVNLDPFPVGTVKCTDIRAPLILEPYYHYQVTYCFENDPDGWRRKVPNIGPRCISAAQSASDPTYGKPVAPTDPNGARIGGLVLLDADGRQITDADPALITENEFDVDRKADFAMLNLFNGEVPL